MLTIPYLELPITHVCNLHCDGCCYYANYNIKTMASADEIRETASAWSTRIKPKMIKILGGEPLANRELPQIFLTLRQMFPETHLQVITNGLQLEKCPMLPYLLTAPNTSLSLSVHSNEAEYLAKLYASMDVINGWISKFGIRAIMSDNRTGWVRHYKGLGQFMRPHTDGDFTASWARCPARVCLVLLEGRLWKCPQTAALHLAAAKFSLDARAEWAPYLAYKGLPVTSSDEELADFLTRGAEAVCGMCPANGESYEKDIHNIDFDIADAVRVERDGTIVRQPALQEALAAE
jgi:hypothetical protein